MRFSMLAIGAVATLAGLIPLSHAVANDTDVCETADGKKGIAACTRVIEAGRLRGHALAVQYFNRGVSYGAMGQRTRAIADYNKAIRVDPSYAYPYNNRGYYYIEKQQYRRALRDFNRAIRLNPRYEDAYVNRAKTYMLGKGDADRAMADLNKAVRLDSTDWVAYHDRGILKRALGDSAGSKADLAKATQLKRRDGR